MDNLPERKRLEDELACLDLYEAAFNLVCAARNRCVACMRPGSPNFCDLSDDPATAEVVRLGWEPELVRGTIEAVGHFVKSGGHSLHLDGRAIERLVPRHIGFYNRDDALPILGRNPIAGNALSFLCALEYALRKTGEPIKHRLLRRELEGGADAVWPKYEPIAPSSWMLWQDHIEGPRVAEWRDRIADSRFRIQRELQRAQGADEEAPPGGQDEPLTLREFFEKHGHRDGGGRLYVGKVSLATAQQNLHGYGLRGKQAKGEGGPRDPYRFSELVLIRTFVRAQK